jgi:hypothetical protein
MNTEAKFKCTCGLHHCVSFAKTRREAAQLGAAHIIAKRSFDRWEKTQDPKTPIVTKLVISLEFVHTIGEKSAVVAGLIAEHLDILEEGIAHFCHHAEEKEKT